jgi:Signal transduction histidine kinase
VFLLLGVVGEGLYVLLVANPLGMTWVAGLVTSLPFTVALLYGGRWLSGSSVSASRYSSVCRWCLGGLAFFLLINSLIMITLPPDSVLRLVSWARWAATLGAGTGLIIGGFEARAIEQAVQTERERVRAEEASARETRLSYLNATLRHEVLNTAHVIIAMADLAAVEHEDRDTVPDYMETIKARTRDMESVIDDVRVLLQASRDAVDPQPLDVTELLTEEVATVRQSHVPVSVETDMPEQAIVMGDQPLRRAFANLLSNAVEHNDSDCPRVEVTVNRTPETVVVRIADDGPGIPESEQSALFDREIRYDDNHGLGLVLTQTLVDTYNGTLDLTETGPDGTVFSITLQRGSTPPRRPNTAGQTTSS